MSNGRHAGKSSTAFHFAAGLGSGVLSAVLLQPADLLKTRVQQSGHSSLLVTIREISKSSTSVLSFWRGTLPSALRTGFGSAIYFTTLNTLRQHVAKSNLLVSMGALDKNGRPSHSSALPKLSNLANLTTGAIARAGAGFILMPMTVLKVRYESNLFAYKSMAGATKDILRTEGLKGFFVGFGATAIRDAPYAGLYVLFYEQLKKRLSLLTQKVPIPGESSHGMKGSTSASINFGSGILAAALATAITNPFDAIKTRLQLEPRKYINTLQAGKLMIRNDGLKSLFDGLGLRMSRKAMSSALAWTLYEELIRRAELAWVEKAEA
ncbi:Solute carrier family 25 member 38-like protein [Venustampulla echinocandica]|uniref:Mitochondrial glycine transporter n=1 Tax=Venustampulla echinocandica TaxID=2656787 RepID=A0A370U2L6_9HELO|nr:Solute carrier family 25 member 38-like protein [Venustampulla echinocandica]RDL42019.1 Solute carrier family 25 member 38-like protein [Venustampulla echinocandica]